MPGSLKRTMSVALLVLLSCQKNNVAPTDATGQMLERGTFTHSPLDQSAFKGLVPLGSLNPSAHTFPTDHLYFYLTDKATEVPLYAPGELTIIRVSENKGGVGTPNQVTDYEIHLGYQDSYISFGHVARLTDAILSGLDFSKGDCQTYTLGTGSVQSKCYLATKIKVSGGDIIGYCGKGFGQSALDLGMYNNLVPVCPIDYYSEPMKSQLFERFSSFDGLIKRTSNPRCGEANQNLDNTAQGVWLNPNQPKYPESSHIALVHDNIDPTIPSLSIGLSVPGLNSNVYHFTPQSSGVINRDFSDISPGSTVYCYTYHAGTGQDLPNTSMLIQLESAKSLKLDVRNCDCACTPYAWSSNALHFIKE
jgi:hypothetical protein